MNFIIADDSAFFRTIFRKQLTSLGHSVIEEARDGEDLIGKVKQHKSDFILTDVNMQPLNGLDASIEIRRLFPELRIICSTQFNVSSWVSEMQLIGISGYVYKNSGIESLKKAIDSSLRNQFYVDDIVFKQLLHDLKMASGNEEGSLSRQIHELFPDSRMKEVNGFLPNSRELLVLSATAQGRPMKQIAQMLNTTERNVSKIKEKMREKVGVATNAELISMSHKSSWI